MKKLGLRGKAQKHHHSLLPEVTKPVKKAKENANLGLPGSKALTPHLCALLSPFCSLFPEGSHTNMSRDIDRNIPILWMEKLRLTEKLA